VEIAGLADTTVVVLVPQSGDEVQTMKAGLMEIADIFVVNKADHADADRFAANLKALSSSRMTSDWQIPVLKTVATSNEGITELIEQIEKHQQSAMQNERRVFLLTEKIWRIIQKERMKDMDRNLLQKKIEEDLKKGEFNLYKLARKYSE
jgi:LAO/AO transport system kinase